MTDTTAMQNDQTEPTSTEGSEPTKPNSGDSSPPNPDPKKTKWTTSSMLPQLVKIKLGQTTKLSVAKKTKKQVGEIEHLLLCHFGSLNEGMTELKVLAKTAMKNLKRAEVNPATATAHIDNAKQDVQEVIDFLNGFCNPE